MAKRKKRQSPKDFLKKYGPGIRDVRGITEYARILATARGDAPESPSHTDLLEQYSTPIPWRDLDSIGIADLMRFRKYSSPTPMEVDQFREFGHVKLLNDAAQANEPEAFTALLLEFLTLLRVRVPEGVLTVWPNALGAPPKADTKALYARWIELGKPSLYEKTLANDFFGAAFRRADAPSRKKMVDRARRACERSEEKRLKSAKIRSEKREPT